MESSLVLLLVLIATLAIIHIVQAQDQQGFISLDCGLPADEQSPYIETTTGLNFSSDATFIQSGKTGRIQSSPVGGVKKPYRTMRYFPDGIRNCYNLNVEKGRTYLIRASFRYGNYDGGDTKPVFDLYLGPNLWDTVDLKQVDGIWKEILHISTSNFLEICLVKTGETTPLVTTLELRPMGNASYIIKSGSLKKYYVAHLSSSTSALRYSSDIYDRIWQSYFNMGLWAFYFKMESTHISTTLDVNNSNEYAPPKDVLQNAATPSNASAPLTIQWDLPNPDGQYYLYAHFAELQDLQTNETREFNMFWNGQHLYGPLTPPKLNLVTVSSQLPITCQGGQCVLKLIQTSRSTHPPLLNAFELYEDIQFPQSDTHESDVSAIKSIAASYAISRINWQGDPCVPRRLRWDGLNCTNTVMSIPPRITSLNLSSNGLTGTIAAAIQNLTQLEKLDLSNNNLTGEVPEFLGNMKSLLIINLTGNNLNGSLPQALQRKGLELSVQGNPEFCISDSCRKKLPKKKVVVPIVASVASAAILVAMLVTFLIVKKKKSTILQNLTLPPSTPTGNTTFANKKSRRFKYSEVVRMTNNFQSVLGKGGFGMVYQGTVNGFEVAVKVLSQSSSQGYKEFKAEVELLLRVHHTNLVTLVGYCYEGDHLALIYEYLSNGDLKHHLSGRGGGSIINWSIRLRIALESALGLEYLHIGCSPPMVHRDVKTANILIDGHFKAKLADFGLSKSFQGGLESQNSTAIAGTPGYLDPEYIYSGRLSEKSDVYSFGVVLLEMITNQPVIIQAFENSHITDWVDSKLSRGDIIEIMDPNLGRDYDSNSAWRALELALSCADPSSSKRPSMSQVIHELKECIVLENSRVNNNQDLEPQAMNISLGTSVRPMPR